MTLVEFLLARIAEDEAPTWQLVPYTCEPGCCAPAGFVGHKCLICRDTSYGGTVEAITAIAEEHDAKIHRRARVLAECTAKRRIVELHSATSWIQGPNHTQIDVCHACGPDSWPLIRDPAAVTPSNEYGFVELPEPASGALECRTLLALAAPWSGHPDFNPEWTRL